MKINIDDQLAYDVAQMAHQANLMWGVLHACNQSTNLTEWNELSNRARFKKAGIIQTLAARSSDNPQRQHEDWQKTAPKDHISNVPYADLSFEHKAKDFIFLAHVRLYRDLIAQN